MSDAADDIVDLYRRHGLAWASARSQQLFEQSWLDRFVSLTGPTRSVLDLGCGSGKPIAQYLLNSGCTVTGVDSSPQLLELAEVAHPDGRWLHEDMRALELGERFSGILAWHSLFHLSPDDQRSMFPVIARHAADAAALMFTTGTSYGSTVGLLEGEPLYHASLDPEEYEELLDANGFEVVDHVQDDPRCGGATVWLAKRQVSLDV